MTDRMREFINSAAPSYEREYSNGSNYISFWDLSKKPKTNSRKKDVSGGTVAEGGKEKLTDREKKLGSFSGQHGVAICDFDEFSTQAVLATGLKQQVTINGKKKTLSGTYLTKRIIEPDNWVFRPHVEGGRGVDTVWAVRLISDHSNRHNERTNRSTMVIDQQDAQKWGHLSECFWVKDVLVGTKHQELFFEPNGFLEGICDTPPTSSKAAGGIGPTVASRPAGFARQTVVQEQPVVDQTGRPRYHLCFNVNKDAGHITDGCSIGQWAHMITLQKAGKTGQNVDGEDLVNAMLRADVRFFSNGGQWGPLSFGAPLPGIEGIRVVGLGCQPIVRTRGRTLTGRHHWDEDTGQCLGPDAPCFDSSEDGGRIQEKRNKGIWVHVEQPFFPDVPTDPPEKVPPDYPSRPAGLTTPTKSSAEVFPTDDFRPNRVTGYTKTVQHPESFTPGWVYTAMVNFCVDSFLDLADLEITSDVVSKKPGESIVSGAVDLTATKTFNLLLGNVDQRVGFTIPESVYAGDEGGKMVVALYRDKNGTDTASQRMKVKSFKVFYGPEVTTTQFNGVP
jgi:hypothetical protein